MNKNLKSNKNILNMSKRDFENVPPRKSFDEDIGLIDSIVILPSKKLHDSGFGLMDFVAVRNEKPICRLSGCSDVIHIGGIGGGHFNNINGNYSFVHDNGVWSIDCLPKSGLLRLWSRNKFRVGAAIGSFEIWDAGTE